MEPREVWGAAQDWRREGAHDGLLHGWFLSFHACRWSTYLPNCMSHIEMVGMRPAGGREQGAVRQQEGAGGAAGVREGAAPAEDGHLHAHGGVGHDAAAAGRQAPRGCGALATSPAALWDSAFMTQEEIRKSTKQTTMLLLRMPATCCPSTQCAHHPGAAGWNMDSVRATGRSGGTSAGGRPPGCQAAKW